jgi:uncharacterized membrane protein YfcA
MEAFLGQAEPTFLTDVIILTISGLLAGFVAGLFGVGGGTITVPILFHWYIHMGGVSDDVAMHVAVGTSLATIITTSYSSSRAHRQKGSVDDQLLYIWAPFICLGSILGVILAAQFSGAALRGTFGFFLLAIAIYMLFTPEGKTMFGKLPTLWLQRAIAGSIGTLSSLVGIGGGAISVPVMSLFGVPLRMAVGTSSAFGMLIAIPGTIGFVISGLGTEGLPPYTLGYVSFLGLLVLLPTSAFTAPIGARLAHKMDRTFLRKIFSLFLTFVSAKMLWGLLVP